MGTFFEARDYCHSIEEEIVRVESQSENEYLFEATKEISRFWLDYNDIKEDGKWVNSDNVPMKFENWLPSQPDNFNNKEDCAEMGGNYKEKWNDLDCYSSSNIICEDYPINSKKYQFTVTNKIGTFFEARNYCYSIGEEIVRVESLSENEKLFRAYKTFSRFWLDYNDIKKEGNWENSDNLPMEFRNWFKGNPDNWNNNEDCVEMGARFGNKWNDIHCNSSGGIICQSHQIYYKQNPITVTNKIGNFYQAMDYCHSIEEGIVRVESETDNEELYKAEKEFLTYWIDYNDIEEEGKWVNSDNVPMKFKNWSKGNPNNFRNNENCAEMGGVFKNKWNDNYCNSTAGIICKNYHVNSKKYQVTATDKMGTFFEAKDYCHSIGENIVRVESMLQNKRLRRILPSGFWVDYTDSKEEGKWVNSDNVPIKFKNWIMGIPSDEKGNEDCVNMNVASDLMWIATDCNLSSGIICQKNLKKFQFTIMNKMGTFNEARDYCHSIGEHLIRVESESQKEEIIKSFEPFTKFWIDYTDIKDEGWWVNSENVPMKFKNWDTGNPDNFNNNEDCAEMTIQGGDKWNDLYCNSSNGIVCQKSDPIKYVKHKFTLTNKQGTFFEARDYCHSIGKDVVRVESLSQNEELFKAKKEFSSYWIDYIDIKKEGNWVNSDNVPMKFKYWSSVSYKFWKQRVNCVIVMPAYEDKWVPWNCLSKNGIICQRYHEISNPYRIIVTNKIGTYYMALQYCKQNHKHLIRIETQRANNLAHEITNYTTDFWLDYTNVKEEGKWVNSDNVLMKFNMWKRQNRPSDSRSNCVTTQAPSDVWYKVSCNSSALIICQR